LSDSEKNFEEFEQLREKLEVQLTSQVSYLCLLYCIFVYCQQTATAIAEENKANLI